MSSDISAMCLTLSDPIRQAIVRIDRTRWKIALVVDNERHLLGTITDGGLS
jgi:hypothetical protein